MDVNKFDFFFFGGVVNINGMFNSLKLKWICIVRVMGVDMFIDDNYVKVVVNGGNIGNNVVILGDFGVLGSFNFVVILIFFVLMFLVDVVVIFRLMDDIDLVK